MPPRLLARNNDRAGGVLPVGAAARAAPAKTSGVRLKLEIRRLPPGLTLTEFEETLGSDWALGAGKVDWREYRQGKIKTSAGKLPEQSRCYVHLASETLLKEIEARFFDVVFHDKAGTHRIPELRHLPPVLSYAPNQRTSLSVKVRSDNRQGTIDQDPEFIAFLEAETQPIAKPAALDAVGVEKKETEKVEKITSTPLIDALREKKANKAKAAASKEEKKEAKGHAKSESRDVTVDPDKPAKDGKAAHKKGDAGSKDNAKAVNKQIATKQQPAPRPSSPQQSTPKPASPAKAKRPAPSAKAPAAAAANPTPPASAPSRPPRQRGNTDGIKKMLQKDLGIRPKAAAAAANPSSPSTPNPAPTATPPSNPTSPPPTTKPLPANARGPKGANQPKPGPNAVRPNTPASSTNPATASTAAAASPRRNPPKPPPPPPNPTSLPAHQPVAKAYLKHANPSQGMTEVLIQQALSAHGEVANVTIDPRKGTAIAIFRSPDAMRRAVEARRVAVANGSVEVLEFRERGMQGGGGGRGGGQGGGGEGQGQAQAQAQAQGEGGARPGRGGHRGRGGKGGRGGGGGNAGGNTNANANANVSATPNNAGVVAETVGAEPKPSAAANADAGANAATKVDVGSGADAGQGQAVGKEG